MAKDVVITQQYVCQIHSRQHIEVCALEDGYLKAIRIKEGQRVKKGDVMFEILPILYKAECEAAVAEQRSRATGVQLPQELAERKASLRE